MCDWQARHSHLQAPRGEIYNVSYNATGATTGPAQQPTTFAAALGDREQTQQQQSVVEGTLWRPACNVYEVGSDIVIHVDLPGVPKEDIQIDTNDIDEIQIHGEAKRFDEFQAASSRVHERNIGRYRKVIRLLLGCLLTNITARYKDGILEVHVPKGDNYRRIDVS
ncbi:hypothetical protein GGF32_005404 [Allomyces javanicus]|nr:hypothetical protein GGF32_005404 [Allomyces javanicus]